MSELPRSGATQSDIDTWLANFKQHAESMVSKGQKLRDQLASNTNIEVTDTYMTITVSPGVQLQDLKLKSAAEGMSSLQLSQRIMENYLKATAQANKRTLDAVREFAGDDSESVTRVESAIPHNVRDAIRELEEQ